MNTNDAIDQITAEIATPEFAAFTIDEIAIGRVRLSGVAVANREGAITLMETMNSTIDRTRRRRPGNHKQFPANLPGAAPTRRLSAEIKLFLKAAQQRQLSLSYMTNTKHVLRVLFAVCGDIPVSQIDDSHIDKLWDGLRWWPTSDMRKGLLKGKTDLQIIKHGMKTNVPTPANRTMNLRLQLVRGFFNRLVAMRALAYSPCDGFKKGIDTSTQARVRRPFSSDELQAMFNHEVFIPWASKYPHRWWLPMLGLYTGARVSELAQLKVKDVEFVDGAWCLHVRKTIDMDLQNNPVFNTRQDLKGMSAIRVIPIAQPLLDAGFLEFVEDIKNVPHARLFPHLSCRISPKTNLPDGTGYAPSFKIQFGKYVKTFGTERKVSFHSFRHYFSTALKKAKVPLEVIAGLTGHTLAPRVPTLEGHYISPTVVVSQEDLVDAIRRLSPPVVLPRYQQGQFAARLGKDAKLYP